MAVVAAAGALLAAAFVLCVGGHFSSYPSARLSTQAGRREAPRWTQPCWFVKSYASGANACQWVRGRVIWIQRVDPDGDGDRHLVVVARLRTHIVKLSASFPVRHLPHIGSAVSATGPVLTGASGRTEIRAQTFTASGRTIDALDQPHAPPAG